jgi:hypothetical protein
MKTRLERRNRTDDELGILNKGGLLDLFDNGVKSAFRINDEEYDFISGELSDEEIKLLMSESYTFSEKRKVLAILSKYYNKFLIFN